MEGKMIKLNAFLFCIIATVVTAPKCPESKKPHATSCTMFYTCIDLPDGGYVWVPSKCIDGLAFQPYLRMCVLPGDTWTCNTSPIESSVASSQFESPELTDERQSQTGSVEEPPDESEIGGSFYPKNDISPIMNEQLTTAYPSTENVAQTIFSKMKDEEIELPLTDNYKQELPEELNDDDQHFLSKLNVNENSRLMNYFTSYIRKTNAFTTEANLQNASKARNDSDLVEKNSLYNILSVLNNQEVVNNIIVIADNSGRKRYLTLDEYKPVPELLSSQTVNVIPCTRNVRLPNTTDCTMYYMCDPLTAHVRDYICPLNTGFNKYTRLCDRQSYLLCSKQKKVFAPTEKLSVNQMEDTTTEKHETERCKATGKMEDTTSSRHYYFCYNSLKVPGKIVSIRMSCPNNLIFCREKKVCAIKRTCKNMQSYEGDVY